MLEVQVVEITMDWTEEERERIASAGMARDIARVRLEAVDGGGRYQIRMMRPEATSIQRALDGETTSRPMTHDLLADVVTALGSGVSAARVTGVEGMTILGELELAGGQGPLVLTARPSDAIALATRFAAPIFVAAELLDS